VGKGDVKLYVPRPNGVGIYEVIVKDVLLIPTIGTNLLSVS